MIGQEASLILDWYKLYFNAYSEHDTVDIDALESLIKLRGGYDKEQQALVLNLTGQLRMPVDEATVRGIVAQLHELDLQGKAQAIISRHQNGEEVELSYELSRLAQDTMRAVSNSSPASWIEDDISSILEEEAGDYGLKFPTIALRDHIKGVLGGASIALGARPDKGKCLAPDTLVRMYPHGLKRADEVRHGDMLLGPDSQPRNVTGVTSGEALMYRIEYPWGEFYDVNEDHVLSLKRSKVEGQHQYGEILNVPVKDYMLWPAGRKARYKGWKSGVEYPQQPITIDPYVLGVWLGDGTTSTPAITSADSVIVEYFNSIYGEATSVQPAGRASTYYYQGGFRQQLKDLNVLGSKHIPEAYLYNTRAVRLALLAGLVDSDGHVGDNIELVSKHQTLAAQYVELARSLGFHATMKPTWKRATNSDHTGGRYWRVRIGGEALDEIPVLLARKLRKYFRPPKRKGLQYGFKVTPIGLGKYNGFCLDGDHLFLLGDFTVTHNTSMLSYILTTFAAQLDTYFSPERPILWLNNEGKGSRIIPRIYQAALGKTIDEVRELSNAGVLVEAYRSIVKRTDRIRVKDVHGASLAQIEQIIEVMKPAVVAFDMLANIRMPGAGAGNKADAVEQAWQEVREMAVRHDFVAISTVQVSADGDDQLYPPYSALKDSKTGIQGATDIILMMGARNDPTMQNIRGISTAKNKYQMPGKPSHVQAQVEFDAERCRFMDGG